MPSSPLHGSCRGQPCAWESLIANTGCARGTHAQGLRLPAEQIHISPRLLADMATYAAGKPSCVKAVVKLLPDLCQVCSRL